MHADMQAANRAPAGRERSRRLLPSLALLLVSGCTSFGVVDNRPSTKVDLASGYSMSAWNAAHDGGELALFLAFSGGGSRAAALTYGILQELRDTEVRLAGRRQRLLDEVDRISAVSGGSFTAAYYGLYGDRIFRDFETDFLRRDVEGALVRRLLRPSIWFSGTGRTEVAVDYYNEILFKDATFADLMRHEPTRPMILINTSDLGRGVRFSFIQEYFNLLCSDLSTYPVARAVAASSAVPVLFSPVVVRNFSGCATDRLGWLDAARKKADGDAELSMVVDGLSSYDNKDQRRYVHFVDGGITDNLGLRALYEIVEVAGGAKRLANKTAYKTPRRLVLISVNAATDPDPMMDISNEQPSLEETVNAVTDAQLHRYNAATLELIDDSLKRWARELSTPKQTVSAHFIQLSFRDLQTPEERHFFNQVPTSFRLSGDQVDGLIKAGRQLLRDNPEYKKLLAELEAGG